MSDPFIKNEMKISISSKLILLVTLLVALTASVISYYFYKSNTDTLVQHALSHLSDNIRREEDILGQRIRELQNNTLFLSQTPPISGIIRAGENNAYDERGKSSLAQWHNRLATIFSTLLATVSDFQQIRFITKNGMELLKVERNAQGKIVRRTTKELQDKSNADYIKSTLKLKAGEIFLSEIRLNRVFGQVTQPHTPIIVAATPVFNQNGELFGLLAIDLDFGQQLQRIEQSYSKENCTLYITNQDGSYLSHPDPAKLFGFELGHRNRIQQDFSEVADLYSANNIESSRLILPGDASNNIMVMVKLAFDPHDMQRFIAIALVQPYEKIISAQAGILQRNLWLVLLLIILATILAVAFSSLLTDPLKKIIKGLDSLMTTQKMPLARHHQDEIGSLARALEHMADEVKSSQQDLQTLNARLEDEVEQQTQEVHQKLQLVNAINQAQTAFIKKPDPKNAFNLMLNSLLELTNSEFGFIGEVLQQEDNEPYLNIYISSNIAWDDETRRLYAENIETGMAFNNLDNLFGQVIFTGDTVLTNDPANDPRTKGLPSGHPPLSAFLGIPIKYADKLIGMVGIANRPNGYHERLLHEIEPFITTCANLIIAYQSRLGAEKSELALQQTRTELERAVTNSPTVFYTAKADDGFHFTYISPNIKQQLGYETHEFLDDPEFWLSHIHPEDKARVFSERRHLFKNGRHSHAYRFEDKQGKYRWICDELQLQFDEQDKPKEIIGSWVDITERKEAELSLQESEQRFRRMADSAPALIWLADTENQGFWFNKRWLEYTGRTMEQEYGLGWSSGVHADDLVPSVQRCSEAFAKREAFEMEFRLRRADGSYGWIVNTGIPRFTENGQFDGYIGYCWDISDRKEAEQALKDSEGKFRSIIASSPMGIFIFKLHEDGRLVITDYNKAASSILGVDCSEFIGLSVEEAFPALAGTEIPERYRRAAAEGVPWSCEDLPYDDQNRIQGVFDLHAFQTEQNVMVVMFQNITDRKRTQDELKRFKSTLDQTQDCVFMFEAQTLNYFYVNKGAMELVGYSQEELMQRHPYEINVQTPNQKAFMEFVQPLVAGEQSSLTFETEYRTKDQRLIPVEVILQYISHENETPRFVAMVRDITERKKIDRMKNEFVSTVSHELRTPLTSIRGSIGLLTGGAVGELPKRAQEMLRIAGNNTERLLLLINDILDMQKIESGQMVFKFKPLDIMALLEQAVHEHAAYGDEHKVSFVITQRQENVRVYADHDRIMQVLSNLMSNAAKFSPEGDTVELALTQHGRDIRITVTDHGPGIPEAFLPKMFEQFTQSDASDSRQRGGTGLGLSIAKAIVERHHGHIHYTTREGVGTSMSIDLPLMHLVGNADVASRSDEHIS